jgi:hypothetical protein
LLIKNLYLTLPRREATPHCCYCCGSAEKKKIAVLVMVVVVVKDDMARTERVESRKA